MGNALHPIFAQALAPFLIAPPQSEDAKHYLAAQKAPFVQSPTTKRLRKSTDTFHYCLSGVDLECEMDYSAGGGDGWNEPRYEATADLCEVYCGTTDIRELLSDAQREEIETAYLEQEPECDICDEPDFADDETSFG